jgi:iduronate 2-sulfatase
MPQLFKASGYWTAGVGKVFHNPNTNPGEVAWHQFEMFKNDEHNERAWRRVLRKNRKSLGGQSPPGHGPTQLRDDQHKDGKNVRHVANWLDEKAYGDKPFFITCGIQKPHVPF